MIQGGPENSTHSFVIYSAESLINQTDDEILNSLRTV